MKNKYRKFVDLLTISNSKLLVSFFFLFFIFTIIAILPKAFAQVQPVKSIEIFSEKLDYLQNEPGSWKITKSANWISNTSARITIDVKSNADIDKNNNDVILILDKSVSVNNDRLISVKKSVRELLDTLFSYEGTKVGLIAFDNDSVILNDFTESKQSLIENVDSLIPFGGSNYYKSLVNVDKMMEDYVENENRNCTVVLLSCSVPTINTPNEAIYYKYLKNKYPFLNFNVVQYDLGSDVRDTLRSISDNQYVVSNDADLLPALKKASLISTKYTSFEIVEQINDDFFSIKNVIANRDEINIDEKKQEVIWKIDSYKSGETLSLMIDVKLKNDVYDEILSTSKTLVVNSVFENISEMVDSDQSPLLKRNYNVIYDGNAPVDCNVTDVPTSVNRSVFDVVNIDDLIPSCEGYQFKGWELLPDDSGLLNRTYFVMPEHDVILRAKWSKVKMKKSMSGDIHEYYPPMLQKVTASYNEELWKYKNQITKVVFQNEINDIPSAIGKWDVSSDKSGDIIGYVVPNDDNSTYTAYIQSDGRIMANYDSSYLFGSFSKLTSIDGIEVLDTSQVVNMLGMFQFCNNLSGVNLSWFDTSKVEIFANMFYQCNSLINLDLSKFNTSRATNMQSMFNGCNCLKTLNLTTFDTTKVVNMSYMFYNCSKLTNLNVSNFVTSSVTDMNAMFYYCSSLTNLDLSNFDTSSVTNMGFMFENCSSLINLDLSNFNTSNVQDMQLMFRSCNNLVNLNISNFDFSKTVNVGYMFNECSKLNTTINIRLSVISNYENMFLFTSTADGARVTINYTNNTSLLVENMIRTKSNNSNVVKGTMLA